MIVQALFFDEECLADMVMVQDKEKKRKCDDTDEDDHDQPMLCSSINSTSAECDVR